MAKKVAFKTEVVVKLDEEEYKALQRSLKSARKPTAKMVKAHFEAIVDQAIDDLLAEFGEDPNE